MTKISPDPLQTTPRHVAASVSPAFWNPFNSLSIRNLIGNSVTSTLHECLFPTSHKNPPSKHPPTTTFKVSLQKSKRHDM